MFCKKRGRRGLLNKKEQKYNGTTAVLGRDPCDCNSEIEASSATFWISELIHLWE
jgi:hypothetical protein